MLELVLCMAALLPAYSEHVTAAKACPMQDLVNPGTCELEVVHCTLHSRHPS